MTFDINTTELLNAAFCHHYHADGSHERSLCKVPEAYCHLIGLLMLKVQELEEKVAAAQRAQVVHFVGGGGGSSGGEGSNGKVTYVSGGGGGGGAGGGAGGGGGGYNPGHYLENPAKPGGYW